MAKRKLATEKDTTPAPTAPAAPAAKRTKGQAPSAKSSPKSTPSKSKVAPPKKNDLVWVNSSLPPGPKMSNSPSGYLHPEAMNLFKQVKVHYDFNHSYI
jgi:hypothetical protein